MITMRKTILEVLNCCIGQSNKCTGALAALIAKAFPSKSNIRNFGEYASSAMNLSDHGHDVFIRLKYIMQLLLHRFGEMHQERHNDALRALSECTLNQFCVWVNERQEAMFLAVKWYIVQCLSAKECPVLYEIVQEHYTSYAVFAETVEDNVGELHRVMRNNALQGRSLLDSCSSKKPWCKNVRISVNSKSCSGARRAKMIINVIKIHAKTKNTMRRNVDAMWALFNRLHATNSAKDLNSQTKVLEEVVHNTEAVRVLWTQHKFDRTAALACVNKLSPRQVTLVMEFAKAVELQYSVDLHNLPRKIKQRQISSRSARQHTNLVCTHEYLYGCPNCKELKAFVVEDGKPSSNAFANGASRVLVDVGENIDDVMYCGRKQENAANGLTGVVAKCCDTRLVQIPAYGNVVTWYGKSYSLCPTCTRVQPHSHEPCCICRSGGDAPVEQEAQDQSLTCFHCGCLNAKHVYGERPRLPVCGSCQRPWMLAQLAPGCTWPEESLELHRAIDRNWGTAKWAEHFDVQVL